MEQAPRADPNIYDLPMPASGQSRQFRDVRVECVLPPIASILPQRPHVEKCRQADVGAGRGDLARSCGTRPHRLSPPSGWKLSRLWAIKIWRKPMR